MEAPDSEPRSCLRRCCDAVPARLIIAIECFTASWCCFMLRINLSLVLLAMVYQSKAEENVARGIVLLPVKEDNPTAFHSEDPLPDGALYPSLHSLVSQWGPPQEKSKFVWSLLGGTFGSVVTWPICSAIIETLGWEASFYIPGAVVCVWSVFWFVFVYDSPSEHPRITPHELQYITTSIGRSVSTHKRVVPFCSVITSCPFIALVVLHFGNLGGLFFQMTEGPKYMSEALGFDLKQSGGFASLPHLMRLLFAIVFCSVGDKILSDPSRNKTLVRKLFVIPSHFMPAALMAPLGYVRKNEALAIALLSLSLGFNGAATVTSLANHHDLGPNYAGSLYGIMDAIGTCTGFIFPAIVGYILEEEGDTLLQWRIIFFIGSGLYLVSGLVFIFFGSAVMQPWNLKQERPTTS